MTGAGRRLLLLLSGLCAAPVLAQEVPDRIDQVLVYDQGDCPAETDDTIVSCVVITGESPYRVPAELRSGPPTREEESPALRAVELLRPVSGVGSCSAAGAGSVYGCSGLAYTDWKKAQGTGESAYYAELLAKARAERLELIDAEAVEEQAIVGALAPE